MNLRDQEFYCSSVKLEVSCKKATQRHHDRAWFSKQKKIKISRGRGTDEA